MFPLEAGAGADPRPCRHSEGERGGAVNGVNPLRFRPCGPKIWKNGEHGVLAGKLPCRARRGFAPHHRPQDGAIRTTAPEPGLTYVPQFTRHHFPSVAILSNLHVPPAEQLLCRVPAICTSVPQEFPLSRGQSATAQHRRSSKQPTQLPYIIILL